MPRILPKSGGIRPYNTTVAEESGVTRVTLYQTVVATYDRPAGIVTLNTGGYDTPTTFRRMNEALHFWGLVGDGKPFPYRVGKSDFKSSNTLVRKA